MESLTKNLDAADLILAMEVNVLKEFVRLHVDEVVDVGVGLVSGLEILLLEGLVDFVTMCHLLS